MLNFWRANLNRSEVGQPKVAFYTYSEDFVLHTCRCIPYIQKKGLLHGMHYRLYGL